MSAEEKSNGRLNGPSQAEPVVSALRASVPDAEPSDTCPTCKGKGQHETGAIVNGVGGLGYETYPCTDCRGTGEIFADDHATFKSDHGVVVSVSGVKRVVFFDYEGDGIFVWAFPNDAESNGPNCTEAERQSVHEQLCAWYDDFCAWDPEDHL